MSYPAKLKRVLMPVRLAFGPLADFLVPGLRWLLRSAPQGQRLLLWNVLATPLLWCSTGTFVAESRFGFKMHASTTDMLSRYVYCFSGWEPNLSTWIGQQLREGDTFVDVGANLGYYTLLAAHGVGPTGRVVAIEASPQILPSLMRNIELNGVRNVRVENVAVTDREGEIEIYFGPINNTGITSIVRQDGLTPGGKVPARPLPAILTDAELTQARLFKIDVEGAEWFVVKGLREALARTRSDAEFVIEISPRRLESLGQNPRAVIDIFSRADFNAYSVVNDYDPSYYLRPHAYEPPKRFMGDVAQDVDIIFSRRDEASL